MKIKFFRGMNYESLQEEVNSFLKDKNDSLIVSIQYSYNSPDKVVMIAYMEDYEDFSEDGRAFKDNLYS